MIKLPTQTDHRGGFIKIFHSINNELSSFSVKQINHVTSPINTIRGLHYQTDNFSEAKFFRVLKGAIQLVFICIDINSKEYLRCEDTTIQDSETGVLIPKGYATGYLCLKENTEVLYISNNHYNPDFEKGIRWNDPSFAIEWTTKSPIVSEKDSKWQDFNG